MKKASLILILLVIIISTAGCGILKSAAALKEYDIGGDSIPSITSVVGERKVTGVEATIKDEVITKRYNYASNSVFDDLLTYITTLREDEGWLVTRDFNLETVPGSAELGKESADEGQILLMTLSYDDSGYELTIVKGEGSIEPKA